MASYCVIGQGMIGKALAKKLGNISHFPTPSTETIFYMAGPTHLDFELNPEYHINKTFQDFLELLPYCKRHRIRFVYCSSALVYEKDTQFTKYKRALELLAQSYSQTLGLRIFPVYGPEEKKTVISQWCEEMKNDRPPKVYGDGTQTRDFIYIDDVVDQILLLESMKVQGLADVGTGNPISFNEIIAIINKELGKNIEPNYVPAPKDYSKGIKCVNPLLVKTNIYGNIKTILGR